MAIPFRRVLAVGAAVVASGVLAFGFVRRRHRRAQIRRVTVAFDGSRRAELQRALDALAARADVSSPEGRAEAAREVCRLLAGAVDAASRALVTREEFSPDDAPPRFDHLAGELRRRYEHETRRNRETFTPPPVTPSPDEPGYLVVTLLVGLDEAGELADRADDRAAVRAVLDALVPAKRGVAALEVIWSPSIDEDRMSERELSTHYPELVPLRDALVR